MCVWERVFFVFYNHGHVGDTFPYQSSAEEETLFPFFLSCLCIYTSGKLAAGAFPRNHLKTWSFSQAGRVQGERAQRLFMQFCICVNISRLFDSVFICSSRSRMFSTSPPVACQEKTLPPGAQCRSLPLGTLGRACWSRLVKHTGTSQAAKGVYCLLTQTAFSLSSFLNV